MNELNFNVVEQTGVIDVNFDELKEQLSEKLGEYKLKEFTEDSKKDAKADLSDLRKLKKAVNDRRIEVKKKFMEPYIAFEDKVKELIELIDSPINFIDGQVKEFEEKRVQEKKAEIKSAYKELVPEELEDYIPLECIYGDKWDNASTNMKTIRKEIEECVAHTESDISTIKVMNSDKGEDALKIYMGNRDLSCAIKYIADYESKKAEILEKKKEEDASKFQKEKQAELDRIRREERERISHEEQIKHDAKKSVVEEMKTINEVAAAPLTSKDSVKAIYTVVGTSDELKEIEMALVSLGVYFERKDV